jgi:putative oxidoreductase
MPLQAFSALLHEPWPLQALMPAHFTVLDASAAYAVATIPVDSMDAMAAAMAAPFKLFVCIFFSLFIEVGTSHARSSRELAERYSVTTGCDPRLLEHRHRSSGAGAEDQQNASFVARLRAFWRDQADQRGDGIMLRHLTRAYDRVVQRAQSARDLPLLVARVSVGWVFVESGWGKLHNLSAVIGYFRDLGIPAPGLEAPFVAGVELVCGALVLAGLATRLAAVPLIATMTVAIVTAKAEEIGSVSDVFGFAEYLYGLALLFLVVEGAGRVSLDAVVRRYAGSVARVQAHSSRASCA